MEKHDSVNNIKICKMDDVSEYISHIDCADADAEFYTAVSENSEEVYTICDCDKVVGLSIIEDDTEGYLYVYIFSKYRNNGYGYLAACAAEQQMQSSPRLSITTAYDANNKIAERFAQKCGFAKTFASSLMRYQGDLFEEKSLPVRKYQDKDFIDAFTLTAEAFHIMRLGTGCFPNSVMSKPNDEARQLWADTADERYVYELDGEIVGYAHIDGAELDAVAIKTSHQGQGIGREFVKYLTNVIIENRSGEPFLYCVVGNKKARQLYGSLGFKEVTCNAYAVKRFEN
ncbi:MAG: GNAT family N-acetyltransferase [Oscillospiraceae bacterium]|nr:GNAT family N-acetyltransferase [Oscillospiraceae bacterium]